MTCRILIATSLAILLATPVHADEPQKLTDLIQQLESGSPGERVIAAEMIGERGSAATEAIPALLKVMKAAKLPDREPSPFEPPPKGVTVDRADVLRFYAARDALVRIGPKSVPALTELLTHESGMARGMAAQAIGWLGADAAEAVPALGKLLVDDNPTVQIHAADALARIGARADAAIPSLVALLGDPKTKDPRVITPGRSSNPKTAATYALAAIGPKGIAALKEKVLPGLIEEYKITKPTPWGGPQVELLSTLGPDAAAAVPAVKDFILRRESTTDLDSLGPTLLKMGPEGVKAFLELLDERKADRRSMIGSVSTSRVYSNKADLTPIVPALVLALKDENKAVRYSAALVLSDLGAKTPPEVIDVVIAGFDEYNVDRAYTLTRIGEAAVPALTNALKSENVAVQKNAADALGKIGGVAKSALPTLRELAQSKNAQLAFDASAAAARISLDPKDATALFEALQDTDPKIRLEATQRLRFIESLAAANQPALIRLVTDEDAAVRQAALDVIGRLGREAPDAIAALARNLPPAKQWGQALNGYGTPLGSTFKPAVPMLRQALSDRKEDVRDDACRLLAQIGPGAKEAIPELIELLAEKRDTYRMPVALAAIGAMGSEAKDAVKTLLTVPLPLLETIVCLGEIGPPSKPAIPVLQQMLTDPNPDIRLLSAFALARIEGNVPKYRAAIGRAMLPPPGGFGGGWVLKVFDKLAPDCPELIPAAVRLFPALSPHDRGVLVASIGKYGPTAKDIVPDLIRLMKDEKGLPQYKEIANTLGAIGPVAKDALPELRRLLDHKEVQVALAAKKAISQIEPQK